MVAMAAKVAFIFFQTKKITQKKNTDFFSDVMSCSSHGFTEKSIHI